MLVKKKILIILLAILAAIAVVLCIPWPRHFSKTVTAIHLDSNGNEIGTVEIRISGTQSKSLFQQQLRKLSIQPFGGYHGMEGLELSKFTKDPVTGYLYFTFGVANTNIDWPDGGTPDLDSAVHSSYTCHVALSDDHNYILIQFRTDLDKTEYFLASLDGKASTQTLKDYFSKALP